MSGWKTASVCLGRLSYYGEGEAAVAALIRLIRCNRDWVSVSVFLLGKDELARFLV